MVNCLDNIKKFVKNNNYLKPILIFDMDGTIIDARKNLSKKIVESFKTLKNDYDLKLSFSTGSSLKTLETYLKPLLPYIDNVFFNGGAGFKDYKTKELTIEGLKPHEIEFIDNNLKSVINEFNDGVNEGNELIIPVQNGEDFKKSGSLSYVQKRFWNNKEPTKKEDFENAYLKISEKLDYIQKTLKKNNILFSPISWKKSTDGIDILNKNFTKEKALNRYCEMVSKNYENISTEQIMKRIFFFGDSNNDPSGYVLKKGGFVFYVGRKENLKIDLTENGINLEKNKDRLCLLYENGPLGTEIFLKKIETVIKHIN